MRSRRRRGLAGVFGVGATAAVAAACFSATAVRLEITTDAPCQPAQRAPLTELFVGASLRTADDVAGTLACSASAQPGINDIGSLVVVPKGDLDDKITVHVVMTTDGTGTRACLTDGDLPKTCIVARRIFRFVEHRTRTLPIRLDSRCAGVRCADETLTCIDGACVVAFVPDDAETPCGAECPGSPIDSGAQGDGAGDASPEAHQEGGPEPCPGAGADGIVTSVVPEAVAEPPAQIAIHGQTLLWTVGAGASTRLFSLDLGSGGGAVERATCGGAPTALAASGGFVWVGTTVGLTRFALADFSRQEILDAASVTGLTARSEGALFSGSVTGNGATLYAVDGASLATSPVPGVAAVTPLMTLGPNDSALVFGVDGASGVVRRINTKGLGVVGQLVSAKAATVGAYVTADAANPIVGYAFDTTVPQRIVRFDWTTAAPTVHCFLTASSTQTLAADETGVYALAGGPEPTLSFCPSALASGAAPVVLAKGGWADIRGLALAPNGCAYFSALPKSAAATYTIRAARRP